MFQNQTANTIFKRQLLFAKDLFVARDSTGSGSGPGPSSGYGSLALGSVSTQLAEHCNPWFANAEANIMSDFPNQSAGK